MDPYTSNSAECLDALLINGEHAIANFSASLDQLPEGEDHEALKQHISNLTDEQSILRNARDAELAKQQSTDDSIFEGKYYLTIPPSYNLNSGAITQKKQI